MTELHYFRLGIPADLWPRISEMARQHRRSITQEILVAIEQYLAREEQPPATLQKEVTTEESSCRS